MSAYSPTLPRTVEPRGTDRLLVLVGSALADLGRRRAAARSRVSTTPRAAEAVVRPDGASLRTAEDRTRDRAALSRASLLP
ncbi:hypothetical protein SAMN05518682_3071 [Cellulosimicrobium aquatile]|uniref:Uncharacterized protein n=1 Tax=Cellulosimicrobium aquatile TaxID=1612203 RepID=A0A1N6UB45_9MICO|nr:MULTISPECIES: hypothetical protein [Cellulosimicrobium]SIQ62799.1 hypothetical protein SAMN05518682_3071 [Cellulosimicrobium aquatile]